ncbi:MAG: right-handed parallel beta-helix repeat-containing protein [Bacteroidaceae bacterium]|nr:right-handed parallel beta-helix repeat-containing protein [Bacteroidaceae bacterium]
MKISLKYIFCAFALVASVSAVAKERVYKAADFGIRPNTKQSQSALMQKAIDAIRAEMKKGDKAVLLMEEGRYDFHPTDASSRAYYVSNHDQPQPRPVGIALEDLHDFVLDGQGAEFVFHGRMMPLSLVRSEDCTLQNFSIDFENPQISQITIVENNENGTTFKPAPWVKYRVTDNGEFITYGDGWAFRHQYGIAFDGKTRHIVYNTADVYCPIANVKVLENGLLHSPTWKDAKLPAGTVIALRGWERPSPGIFVTHCENTRLLNVKMHYAEGMGLLAQMSENLELDGFSVCLKGDNDARYFTTQADATHFSGCKGKIISVNGLYEGMMDDAINVHGTYLKVVRRVDDYTLEGRYMHSQAYGFDWGYKGDKVQFVRSASMELLEGENEVLEITPLDPAASANSEGMNGAKTFRIKFKKPVPAEISEKAGYGIENLTWTPEVYFAHNTIRNNRARGTLFSTPRKVVVEHNLFDHTSGCAILLCGDCNGWFETGACRDVVIRHNRFVNALTSQFQFTNAVISIYPEIPNLDAQKSLFHGGKKDAIRIEKNVFETFDAPILYAKSVDGLVFRKNEIVKNKDFKPFHWNNSNFLLQRVNNVDIDGVLFYRGGGVIKEVKLNQD